MGSKVSRKKAMETKSSNVIGEEKGWRKRRPMRKENEIREGRERWGGRKEIHSAAKRFKERTSELPIARIKVFLISFSSFGI